MSIIAQSTEILTGPAVVSGGVVSVIACTLIYWLVKIHLPDKDALIKTLIESNANINKESAATVERIMADSTMKCAQDRKDDLKAYASQQAKDRVLYATMMKAIRDEMAKNNLSLERMTKSQMETLDAVRYESGLIAAQGQLLKQFTEEAYQAIARGKEVHDRVVHSSQ